MRYAILLLCLIIASGCVSQKEFNFNLDPPISAKILSAMNWNESEPKELLPITGGWGIKSAVGTLIVTKASPAAAAEKRQQMLRAVNVTVGYIEPYIFYSKDNQLTSMTQVCDGRVITASVSNSAFAAFLDALKNYGCSAGDVAYLSLYVPDFSIISNDVTQILKSMGYNPSSITIAKNSQLRMDFASGLNTITIAQDTQDYSDYTSLLIAEDEISARQDIPIRETIKNGAYWFNPASGFVKALWHCADRGITVRINNVAKDPLSIGEVKEIARYLC